MCLRLSDVFSIVLITLTYLGDFAALLWHIVKLGVIAFVYCQSNNVFHALYVVKVMFGQSNNVRMQVLMFIAILFCSKPHSHSHSRFQRSYVRIHDFKTSNSSNKESETVEARLFTSSVCLRTKSSRSVLSYRTGCTQKIISMF